MILLSVLVAIILFATWLLVAPLILTIDSRNLRAELNWRSIGHAELLNEKDGWVFRFRVWFYSRKMPVDSMHRKASAEKKVSGRKKKPAKSFRKYANTALHVMRTFRISQCIISVDTADAVLNAWMHIGYASATIRRHVEINYSDQNKIFIQVRNRPIRILYAFLKSHFFN